MHAVRGMWLKAAARRSGAARQGGVHAPEAPPRFAESHRALAAVLGASLAAPGR
jgi:hypothetical protein